MAGDEKYYRGSPSNGSGPQPSQGTDRAMQEREVVGPSSLRTLGAGDVHTSDVRDAVADVCRKRGQELQHHWKLLSDRMSTYASEASDAVISGRVSRREALDIIEREFRCGIERLREFIAPDGRSSLR